MCAGLGQDKHSWAETNFWKFFFQWSIILDLILQVLFSVKSYFEVLVCCHLFFVHIAFVYLHKDCGMQRDLEKAEVEVHF